MRRSSRAWLALAGVAVLASAATWGVNRVFSELSCAWDTSVCGDAASSRTEYRGRLFDHRGRPASETALEFGNALYGDDFGLRVVTDEQGRFCVRAATFPSDTEIVGQGDVSHHVVRSSAPVDPRFEDPEVLGAIRREQGDVDDPGPDYFGFMVVGSDDLSADGAYTVKGLWTPALDSASTCDDPGRGPIWYRFEDNAATWQYKVLEGGLYLVLALLFVAAVLWFGARYNERDPRPLGWVLRAVVAVAALHVALFVVLWFG
jgi:hypothetical protein